MSNNVCRTVLCCAVVAAMSVRVARCEPTKVLFHCSFDDTLRPSLHAGSGEFTSSLPPHFVAGRKGRALVTGHLRGVRYALKDNLRTAEGTVSFWVQPLDWNREDETFHHFFAVPDNTAERRHFGFLLYKFRDWPQVVAHGMAGELAGDRLLRVPMDAGWVAGQWHQIVFTWDAESATLYVDGHGQTMRYRAPAPLDFGAGEFLIGGPYYEKNLTLTAVDELIIYDRALSRDEVTALWRKENAQ